MNDVDMLLQTIKKRPCLYIGKKSLDRLVTYVSGYMHRAYEAEGVHQEFLPGFQDYIAELYGIHSAHHWSSIIQFYCSYEEEAFDKFYELLDDFLKQNQ